MKCQQKNEKGKKKKKKPKQMKSGPGSEHHVLILKGDTKEYDISSQKRVLFEL